MTEVSEPVPAVRRQSPLTSAAGLDLMLFAWLMFAVVLTTALSKQPGGDWSFFVRAADALGTDRWGWIYVDHPNAQTGPLTIVVAWALDPWGLAAVRLAIMLTGVAVMGVLVWSTRGLPHVRWRLVAGGTVLALWWPQMSFFGHLDDALVLLLAVIGVVSARRDRPMAAGALAGFAIGVKPTGVFLLALALPRRGSRTLRSWAPLLTGCIIGLACWAPFVLATTDTLDALRPRVQVYADSVLALLGQAGEVPPAWMRVLQLFAVVGLAAVAMRFRGPAAVLWMGVAARLLLDPAAWPYYTAGFVLGALVWEAYETQRRVPWATLAGAVLLAPRWMVESDTTRAWLRLAACVGAIVVVFAGDRLRRSATDGGRVGQVAGEVTGHQVARS